jgi:hypothetical protein
MTAVEHACGKELLGRRGEKGTVFSSTVLYCPVRYGYGSSSFFSLGEVALGCLHLPDWGPGGEGARRLCLSGPVQLSQLGRSKKKALRMFIAFIAFVALGKRRRPAPGSWSASHTASHRCIIVRNFPLGCKSMCRGDNPSPVSLWAGPPCRLPLPPLSRPTQHQQTFQALPPPPWPPIVKSLSACWRVFESGMYTVSS